MTASGVWLGPVGPGVPTAGVGIGSFSVVRMNSGDPRYQPIATSRTAATIAAARMSRDPCIDEVSGYSRRAMAPYVCAALNLAAVLVLALVLAPGTTLVPSVDERVRYIAEHLVAWRVAWTVWMAAAVSLLWFYAWWRARVGGPHAALAVACAGIVADWSAELALIVSGAEGHAAVAPFAFVLTGAVANGLYTIAGVMLTLATPLPTAARVYAALMWTAGGLLSVGALANLPLLTAISTGELFALFVPWCVWLGRHLRRVEPRTR